MIEFPEAVTIAGQLDAWLRGKRIVSGKAGNSPHKWVFYTPSREAFADLLGEQTTRGGHAVGRAIHIRLESERKLIIDDFGGRVLVHAAGDRLPSKYHLLLHFDDESFLTVAIQGWGFFGILTEAEWQDNNPRKATAISPMGQAFTPKRFSRLFDQYEKKDKDSIKIFFTNGESVAGIGNGYLQDILFRAKIHPRRRVGQITEDERIALYDAVRETIRQAVNRHGRESERDIHGNRGRYKPIMDKDAAGGPCPVCGTSIRKMSYLGGSCYLCPTCQK